MSKRKWKIYASGAFVVLVALAGIWAAAALSDDGGDGHWSTEEVEALIKRVDHARSVACSRLSAEPQIRRWRCRVVSASGDAGVLVVRVDREGNVSSHGRGVAGVAVAADS